MKSIKAIKNFTLNGTFYEAGDSVEVKNVNDLVRLNEKGFIEPLTGKEIQTFERNLYKEEE